MSSDMSVGAMNLSFIQSAASTVSNIQQTAGSNTQSEKTEAIYAKEGDSKYDEAMDENADGVITYEEYLTYVQENLANSASAEIPSSGSVSVKTDDSGNVQTVNAGKALSAYSNAAQGVSGLNRAVITGES